VRVAVLEHVGTFGTAIGVDLIRHIPKNQSKEVLPEIYPNFKLKKNSSKNLYDISNMMNEITKSHYKKIKVQQFGELRKLVKEGNVSQVKKVLKKSDNVKTLLSMKGSTYQIQTTSLSRNWPST
jgi:peroxiredoxin family protein